MLKIRDLGINLIPATMPPEIGMGGGYAMGGNPPGCGETFAAPGSPENPPCNMTMCGNTFAEPGSPEHPPCGATACGSTACGENTARPKRHSSGVLPPEVISALRQQMQLQLR